MTRPTTRTGLDAAESWIDSLDEPRRAEVRHLHEVIRAAIPDADVVVMDYSGPIVGYGTYEYSTSKGPAGRWFSVGLASRKSYISLFSMATGGGGYLVETLHDRFPGTKIGRSCINITTPELIDDSAVRDLATQTWAQFKDGQPAR